MTPPSVEIVQSDQLRKQRIALLAKAGMSEEDLRARAEEYTLPEELVVIFDEVNEINFLLGD